MNKKAFSLNIRKRRIEQGLSQKALSQATSISRVSINHYETGKKLPKPDALERICNQFKCTATDLLGF